MRLHATDRIRGMHPILFRVAGFPIRSFGLMVALGFVVGTMIYSRLVTRTSDDPERDVERYGAIPVWVLFGVVLGARLLYVVVEIAKGSGVGRGYLDDPLTVFAIWEGGLVMYGGLFGSMAAGVWCAKRQKVPLRHALDLGLSAGFFGLAIGRIGCLLVGDDYGSIVPEAYRDLPFPITLRVPQVLPEQSLFGAENAGQVLWATQPWMTVNAVLIGLVGVWLLKRRRYPGQVSLVLLLLYAVTRSVIEHFRGDDIRGKWFGDTISTSQLIGLVAGLVVVFLLFKYRGRRETLAGAGTAQETG